MIGRRGDGVNLFIRLRYLLSQRALFFGEEMSHSSMSV